MCALLTRSPADINDTAFPVQPPILTFSTLTYTARIEPRPKPFGAPISTPQLAQNRRLRRQAKQSALLLSLLPATQAFDQLIPIFMCAQTQANESISDTVARQ
jgi:hypothetical protein